MANETVSYPTEQPSLVSDLGTFEGFNFNTQSAIAQNLTAQEVVAWDHDRQGEAEFWPAGDLPEVALIFQGRSSVSASELLDLDRVLVEMGGDARENFLQIHYAVNNCGNSLHTLSAEDAQDQCLHIFSGGSFLDVRREAAHELFELYFPEAYQAWEKSLCDGLIFDAERFLDSPSFSVEEVKLGEDRVLLVAPC